MLRADEREKGRGREKEEGRGRDKEEEGVGGRECGWEGERNGGRS